MTAIHQIDLDVFNRRLDAIVRRQLRMEGLNLEESVDDARRSFLPGYIQGKEPRPIIEIVTHTGRAPGGCGPDDCDGTSSPSSAMQMTMKILAQEFGLRCRWEPCEKGLGSYYFEVPEDRQGSRLAQYIQNPRGFEEEVLNGAPDREMAGHRLAGTYKGLLDDLLKILGSERIARLCDHLDELDTITNESIRQDPNYLALMTIVKDDPNAAVPVGKAVVETARTFPRLSPLAIRYVLAVQESVVRELGNEQLAGACTEALKYLGYLPEDG